MKNFVYYIVLIFLAAGGFGAKAQQPISRGECREMAVRGSEELQIARGEVTAAGLKVRSTKRGALPSLTSALSSSYTIGNPLGDVFEVRSLSYGAQLRAQQVIYGGNRVRAQVQVDGARQDVLALALLATTQQLQHTADSRYNNLLLAQQMLGVQGRYLGLVRDFAGVVSSRFEEGYIPRTDYLMAQNRLVEAQQQWLAAGEAHRLAQQALSDLFGTTDVVDFVPTDTLLMPDFAPDSDPDSLLHTAIINRSDYLVAIATTELQKALERTTAAAYNPQLLATITGHYGTPTLNMEGSDNPLYGVAGLSFTATIFNFGKRRLDVQQQRIATQNARISAQEVRTTIAQEINQAQIQLHTRFEQCGLTAQQMADAAQSLELVTFSYTEGRLTVLDVLQAQIAWLTAYTTAINAQYNYAQATANFHRAVGNY